MVRGLRTRSSVRIPGRTTGACRRRDRRRRAATRCLTRACPMSAAGACPSDVDPARARGLEFGADCRHGRPSAVLRERLQRHLQRDRGVVAGGSCDRTRHSRDAVGGGYGTAEGDAHRCADRARWPSSLRRCSGAVLCVAGGDTGRAVNSARSSGCDRCPIGRETYPDRSVN